MKSPFPYFGNKKKVAALVWNALGDVDTYVEPFFGSGAVLMNRPPTHQGTVETANDMDGYLINFWRAVKLDPVAVAKFADDPMSEVELLARSKWLIETGAKRIERMKSDPDFFSAKAAGWWAWGLSQWIGSGWCIKTGKSKLPTMGGGSGVHRQEFIVDGQPSLEELTKYFQRIARRFRRVRTVCGSWERVLTDGCLCHGASVGVFLDPPYAGVGSEDLYRSSTDDISPAVRQWCIEHGEDRRLRIVLAGYVDEHGGKMPESWKVHKYSAGTSFQSSKSVSNEEGNAKNRHKERLWLSPGCVDATRNRYSLLDALPSREEE